MDFDAAIKASIVKQGPKLQLDAVLAELDGRGDGSGDQLRNALTDPNLTNYRIEKALGAMGVRASETSIGTYRRHLREWGEATAS